VEKREESLKQAVGEEEQTRIRHTIVAAKDLLARFKQEERNHFLSGSYTQMDIWGDSDEDEEDNEDETVEIVAVTRNNKQVNMDGSGNLDVRMNQGDFKVEDFMDSEDDDEEMVEA
jgi:predicted site-specific integrase-resolvase